MRAISVTEGGFAYLPGQGNPFSRGVVALAGHALVRVRLRGQLPMAEGFAYAVAFLAARGRPALAFAACELRSPAAMSRSEFPAFNDMYADLLRQHGFITGETYPVARSNMAPQFAPPGAASLFAFTFAVPCDGPGGRDFLISGKPENLDDGGIVAPGDISPGGMAAKAAHVLAQLRGWTEQLGASWSDITGAQAYTIHSLDGVIDVLRDAGIGDVGLTLFPAFPPIDWCEFEIDVRAVSTELVL
jgi:hypothetical protein